MAGIGGPLQQQSGIPRRPPQPPAEDQTPSPSKGRDEPQHGDATELLLSEVSNLLGRFESQLMRNLDQWVLRHADLLDPTAAKMAERSSTLEQYMTARGISTSSISAQRSSTSSQPLAFRRLTSPSDNAQLKPEPVLFRSKSNPMDSQVGRSRTNSTDSQVGGCRVDLMREHVPSSPRGSLNATSGSISGQTKGLPMDLTKAEGPKRVAGSAGNTGGASVGQQHCFEPRPAGLARLSLSEEDAKRRKAADLRVHTDRLKSSKAKASARMELLVTSHQFEAVVAGMIVANAAFIGVDAHYQTEHLHHPRTVALFAVECLFTVMFIIEWLIRVIAFKRNFFRGSDTYWNILDTGLVISSLVQVGLSTFMYTGAIGNVEVDDVTTVRLLRVLRIAKIVRALRMTRLFRFVASLRTLVASIFATLQSLMWALLLLLFMIYLVAVVLTQALPGGVVDSHDPRLAAYWGSLPTTMRTLFQSITSGIDWQDAAEPLDDVSWLLSALFMLYIFLSCFAVLNVVTGVFCQSAIEAVALDPELSARNAQRRRKTHEVKLRALFTAGDVDSSGQLNVEELETMLSDEIVQSYLAAMNIDLENAWSTFKLLDVDDSLSIDRDEFVDGMLRLQGAQRNAQLQEIMQTQKWMSRQLHIPETIHEEETAED